MKQQLHYFLLSEGWGMSFGSSHIITHLPSPRRGQQVGLQAAHLPRPSPLRFLGQVCVWHQDGGHQLLLQDQLEALRTDMGSGLS